MTGLSQFRNLWLKFYLYSLLKSETFVLPQSGQPRCFVFLAADYGNLGDVAITYAQEKFLKEKFPDYEIVDVPISRTLTAIRSIKRQVRHDDIVTIVGGGNMGDMYHDIEMLRLMVVKAFRNNRIISFPQTIDYSNSADARWLFGLGRKIYNRHSHLTICARETVSYERMKQWYPKAKVVLTPDIVMTLDKREPVTDRTRVAFCLRDDKEKTDNSHILDQIRLDCDTKGLSCFDRDTHIGRGNLTVNERVRELEKIWADFRTCRFIVTDRLHGMIFAYITGTPAIVLPNSNFKVEKCHHWIKDCGYIHFGIHHVEEFLSGMVGNRSVEKFRDTRNHIIQVFERELKID